MNNKKLGEFDWILSFKDIKSLLQPLLTPTSRVLVIGCGTSSLSKNISELNGNEVVSIDNDADVIAHMADMYSDSKLLKWYTYDMVERQGDLTIKSEECTEYFDIILDKGTLDAILVEGCVYTMLCEVHRLLRPGGFYALCSINSERLLQSLIGSSALNFHIQKYILTGNKHSDAIKTQAKGISDGLGGEDSEEMMRYNLNTGREGDQWAPVVVMLCQRANGSAGFRVDENLLQQQEHEAVSFFFQDEMPLLTPEFAQELQNKFLKYLKQTNNTGQSYVPIKIAYELMFEPNERAEYTPDLFVEDISRFQLQQPGMMSIDDCMNFIREMQ